MDRTTSINPMKMNLHQARSLTSGILLGVSFVLLITLVVVLAAKEKNDDHL